MKRLLFIPLLLICTTCFAAELTISGVSGNVIEGQSIVITGESFGTKTTAAPLRWANFDDGTDGATLSGTNWYVSGTPNYDDGELRHARDELNIKNTRLYGGASDEFYEESLDATEDKIFISFYVLIDNYNLVSSTYQLKLWRISTARTYAAYPDVALNTHWTNGVLDNDNPYYEFQGWDYGGSVGQDGEPIVTDKWLRVSCEIDQSSGVDVKDGSALVEHIHDYDTRYTFAKSAAASRIAAYPDKMDTIKLGFTLVNASNGHEIHTYWDDVYIDNTWSRVVIGNNADFDSCTHKEIQIPSAWASDEVTITVNRGAFNTGTAYLFVVNSDGSASAGYEITIGGTSTKLSNIKLSNITFN